jgi:ATP phosphoribosyltransferase
VLAFDPLLISTTVPIALIPKNRGLTGQLALVCERLVPAGSAQVSVRGEDVPMLADAVAKSGRSVVAFTGDDLLDEWLLAGNTLHPRLLRRRIAWRDPQAIYGAPALCLIGRSDDALRPDEPVRRVAVCSRYRALAERFLRMLHNERIALEPVLVSGAVERFVDNGVADFAIDIVVTGSTLAKAGLSVRRVISTSDVAVLETA